MMKQTLVVIMLILVGLGGGWALITLGPERGGWIWVWFSFAALLVLAAINARYTNYKCGKCGYIFQIGVFAELFSAHSRAKGKHLRCSRCGQVSWAQPSRKEPPRRR